MDTNCDGHQVCEAQHLVTESPMNKILVPFSLSTKLSCCAASGELVYGQRYSGISDRCAVPISDEADASGNQPAHRSMQNTIQKWRVHSIARVLKISFSIVDHNSRARSSTTDTSSSNENYSTSPGYEPQHS